MAYMIKKKTPTGVVTEEVKGAELDLRAKDGNILARKQKFTTEYSKATTTDAKLEAIRKYIEWDK